MFQFQYDLFEPTPTEFELMQKEIADMRETNHKVRRGLFAKQNEMAKTLIELKEEIHKLKFELHGFKKMMT